jgi:hypothetical protein
MSEDLNRLIKVLERIAEALENQQSWKEKIADAAAQRRKGY